MPDFLWYIYLFTLEFIVPIICCSSGNGGGVNITLPVSDSNPTSTNNCTVQAQQSSNNGQQLWPNVNDCSSNSFSSHTGMDFFHQTAAAAAAASSDVVQPQLPQPFQVFS